MSETNLQNNEISRLKALVDLDVDYLDLENEFSNITALTSRLTGMNVSMLNLIDSNTLWPISQQGSALAPTNIEDSVCQYTVAGSGHLEIPDLSADERFSEKAYVKGAPFFKSYLGVPLQSKAGANLGTLCVFDSESKLISNEKIELMKIIAQEAVEKLKSLNAISSLRKELATANNRQKEIAKELRDPLAGIVGLSDVLMEQINEFKPEDIKEYSALINVSSKSILDAADEIIVANENTTGMSGISLIDLKEKLVKYYAPLANPYKVSLQVEAKPLKEHIRFLKNNLLQIIGNLLSYTIQSTNQNGNVLVSLDAEIQAELVLLSVSINSGKFVKSSGSKNLIDITEELIIKMGGTLDSNEGLLELTMPIVSVG